MPGERTGELRRRFDFPANPSEWSHDGAFVVLKNGDVWDTQEEKTRFNGGSDVASFSRDGSVVVFWDSGWTAYDTADGTTRGHGPELPDELLSSVSDDGQLVAFETGHGVRLVRIETGRSLELHLVRTDKGVEPIFVLDTGHFTASTPARGHIKLRTDHGELSGDAPDNAFRRDDVWLDFLAP